MDKSARSRFTCLPSLILVTVILCISLYGITVEAFVNHNSLLSKSTQSGTAIAATEHSSIVVTLTREDGKNEKLRKKIKDDVHLQNQIDLLELPCIEHAVGPDYDRLSSTLRSGQWDYIAITSPEAANVLVSAWDAVRDNPPPVVAVGKATETKLKDSGILVTFVPSKATAATLANELELLGDEQPTSVLYPASAKAKKVLENGLVSRGFTVKRLNTYDTVTAAWEDDQRESSERVQVACFGSPSAVKGWLKNTKQNTRVFAACIGHTSASACKELGWKDDQIFFPEAPGLEGWVEAIQKATEAAKEGSSCKK
jgi:uroporphyrinogen-III synthase